jgi:hypothetical protein
VKKWSGHKNNKWKFVNSRSVGYLLFASLRVFIIRLFI